MLAFKVMLAGGAEFHAACSDVIPITRKLTNSKSDRQRVFSREYAGLGAAYRTEVSTKPNNANIE
jgi:hypothetical protein